MGSDYLTLSYTFSKYKNRVKQYILANSGANSLTFLNAYIACNLTIFYNISFESLPCPIRVKGYKGKSKLLLFNFSVCT